MARSLRALDGYLSFLGWLGVLGSLLAGVFFALTVLSPKGTLASETASLLSPSGSHLAQAADIIVNSTINTVKPDDGLCTLREAITAANTDTASGAILGECPAGSEADTIELDTRVTYNLDVPDNFIDGFNSLPSIVSQITINGHGSTIERDALAPGFRVFHVGSAGNLILNNLTINGGHASGSFPGGTGGGIFLFRDARMTITNSTISGNTATQLGGGIYNFDDVTVTITNSTISGNTASRGGGIHSNSSTMTITNSTFVGNRGGDRGGGINMEGDSDPNSLIISASTFSGNTATRGGGIYSSGFVNDKLTITNSTFSRNTAGSQGGGIFIDRTTVDIAKSTISNNTAGDEVGGILNNSNGTVTITNSTISGNTATLWGGGIHNIGSGTLMITNGTITHNILTDTRAIGGGIFIDSGKVDLKNTIIAENFSGFTGADCFGSPTSLGHNLIGDDTCCNFAATPGDLVAAGGSPIDPLVGPLRDNGGPTETHALLPGSPAIDHIPPEDRIVETDQRGVSRPQNRTSDIGAYEFGPCGDQNSDAVVDVSDVIIDLQIAVDLITPTPTQLFLSDLKRDGAIDVFDAIMGLRHIVGLIPTLEECGSPPPAVRGSDIINFKLESFTVSPRTAVTWTNQDLASHTVTSGRFGDPDAGSFFDSGPDSADWLRQGDTFTFTFGDAGVFPYFCRVHPFTMNGAITVG